MANDLLGRLSGTGNPYAVNTYTPVANEKNTLTTIDYFKPLAVQLANQDMTDPMDNSEMITQMTQMATMQAVSAITESVQTPTSISTQIYVAELVGQEIIVAVTEEGKHGQNMAVGVQYGKVESVDFTGSTPVLELMGGDNEYPLSHVLGMGKIDDPYEKDEASGKQTRGEGVGSEKTDFPAYDYVAEEDNPLTNEGILTRFSYTWPEKIDLWG